MQKIKRALRTGLLYGATLVMTGAYSLPVMTMPVAAATTPANASYKQWKSDKEARQAETESSATPVEVPPSTENPPTEQVPVESIPTTTSSTEIPVEAVHVEEATTNQTSTDVDTDIDQTALIENNETSSAATGNADVNGNTTAGHATTGNALAETTILNVVHSSVQGSAAGVAHFTSDIYGNVVGDITLSSNIDNAISKADPASIGTTKVDTTTHIANTIALDATSGNATVSENTTAGNATTGTANTVANIVNLINSIIAANQSFIGTINIYGNLDGDILVSPSFIPQLLANNANLSAPDLLSLQSTDNQTIINNIELGAHSGSATVSGNTTAGNATTGAAATNLTVLNLSGHQVTASNSLLVFVNVLGTWIGVIVDAPVGTTAAMLGNGVSSSSILPAQTLSSNSNGSIVNNLTLTSKSGDASVVDNTTAGNATSGNATASANIVNMTTSTFSISDWFGILFINVFGTWNGSFGVNTLSGEVVPLAVPSVSQPVSTSEQSFKFGFIPKSLQNMSPQNWSTVAASVSDVSDDIDENVAVLAAMTDNQSSKMNSSEQREILEPQLNLVAIAIMIIGAVTAAGGLSLMYIRR